jgi:hypothetical protein
MTPDQQSALWIGACRYYLRADSAAAMDYIDALIEVWPALTHHARDTIRQDVLIALQGRAMNPAWGIRLADLRAAWGDV